MKTVREWVETWIEANGHEKCDGDRKLILQVSDEEEIYCGHFLDVPEELLDRKVYKHATVLDSTEPARRGAFDLTISREPLVDRIHDAASKKDGYIESQLATLDVCDLVLDNRFAFPADQVAKAEKLKAETLDRIQKREKILASGRE